MFFFFSDWCNKKGVPIKCFTQWISLIIENVNKRIEKLKNKFKFSKVKHVCKGSKGDFLLKNLTRTICHVPY